MRFIGLFTLVGATAALRSAEEHHCHAVCKRANNCENDKHGMYCKTWQNPKVCFGLYWTDATRTTPCFQPADPSCPEHIPVKCDGGEPATETPREEATSQALTDDGTTEARPCHATTTTEAPAPCDGATTTTTESPAPCHGATVTTTKSPAPCHGATTTTTESPAPCHGATVTTTKSPAPCDGPVTTTESPNDTNEAPATSCVQEVVEAPTALGQNGPIASTADRRPHGSYSASIMGINVGFTVSGDRAGFSAMGSTVDDQPVVFQNGSLAFDCANATELNAFLANLGGILRCEQLVAAYDATADTLTMTVFGVKVVASKQ